MRKILMVGAVLALGVLTACGGGDTPPTNTNNNGGTNPSPTAPANPTNVKGDLNSSAVLLTWDAVTGATGYKVDRKSGSGAFAEIASLNASKTAYLDSNLASGTYTYRVRTVGAAGTSLGAEASAITIKPKTESQIKADAMLGVWNFTYTLSSKVYTDKLAFLLAIEDSAEPGDYIFGGYDQYDNTLAGWYDFEKSKYVVGSDSTVLPTLYMFTISGNTASGCVYFKTLGTWGACRSFTGVRVSSLPTGSIKPKDLKTLIAKSDWEFLGR